MNKKYLAIIVILILAIIAAAVYFLKIKSKSNFEAYKVLEKAEVLEEKATKQAEIDPVENLPNTNPFEAKTNPFEDSYKNPFE